jgi:hypothetical protein
VSTCKDDGKFRECSEPLRDRALRPHRPPLLDLSCLSCLSNRRRWVCGHPLGSSLLHELAPIAPRWTGTYSASFLSHSPKGVLGRLKLAPLAVVRRIAYVVGPL